MKLTLEHKSVLELLLARLKRPQKVLVGVVGADRVSQDFRKALRSAKVSDFHLIIDAKRRTVLKERIVSERQQLLRVDYEDQGVVSDPASDRLARKIEKLVLARRSRRLKAG